MGFSFITILILFLRYVYCISVLRYDFNPFKNDMIVSASIKKTNETPVMMNNAVIKPSNPPFVAIKVFKSINKVTLH